MVGPGPGGTPVKSAPKIGQAFWHSRTRLPLATPPPARTVHGARAVGFLRLFLQRVDLDHNI